MPFLNRTSHSRAEEALLWAGDEYQPDRSPARGLNDVGVPASLAQVQRRLCGHVDCSNGWTMPWRSRRRPIFEEKWGCSGRCVLAMVREDAVRKPKTRSIPSTAEAPRKEPSLPC